MKSIILVALRKTTVFILTIALSFMLTSSGCNRKTVDFFSLNLENLNGEAITSADYKGKPLFLNFYATWCPPCVKEMPSMAKAQQLMAEKGVEFLVISEEKHELLKKFKERNDYPFTYLHSTRNIKLLGVFTIPQTYLVNAKGEVIYSHTGYKDWSTEESLALISKLAL